MIQSLKQRNIKVTSKFLDVLLMSRVQWDSIRWAVPFTKENKKLDKTQFVCVLFYLQTTLNLNMAFYPVSRSPWSQTSPAASLHFNLSGHNCFNVIPIQGCSWVQTRVQPSRQKGGQTLQTTWLSLRPCLFLERFSTFNIFDWTRESSFCKVDSFFVSCAS